MDTDADSAFPLFCPVRERDWLESWNLQNVFSTSGFAEPGCVFTSLDANGESTWIISQHDTAERTIQMVKFTPRFTACLLNISVASTSATRCEVTVSYSHAALSEKGADFVLAFSEALYAKIMSHWKGALDHYLENGSPLPGS